MVVPILETGSGIKVSFAAAVIKVNSIAFLFVYLITKKPMAYVVKLHTQFL